jgi:hypothetical protein
MPDRPVVALDIDGTGGDYHAHFTRFAQEWTGRKMPDPASINPGLPLHKHLGMSKAYYRQCKLAYRQGGLKRSMPVYPGFAEMTKEFRHAGAAVAICTTRPYLRLDNIDPDTRHWLRRNGIQYDWVLFGTHKYRDLAKQVGASHIIAVLDDLVELVGQARSLGIQAWLRDQPYNRYTDEFPRVMNFEGDPWRDVILNEIRKWYSHEGVGHRGNVGDRRRRHGLSEGQEA